MIADDMHGKIVRFNGKYGPLCRREELAILMSYTTYETLVREEESRFFKPVAYGLHISVGEKRLFGLPLIVSSDIKGEPRIVWMPQEGGAE